MKLKNVLKIISISIVVILIIIISSINYAAGNCAFSAGGVFDGIDTTQEVLKAKDYYASMGYSSYYTNDPTFSVLNGYFKNGTRRLESDIVFLSGHGDEYGKAIFLKNTGVNFGPTTGNYVGLDSVVWNRVNLITYAACRTAFDPEEDYSNIAVVTYRKGAATVVGWRHDLDPSAHSKWLNRYNAKLAAGGSIGDAINYANSFNDYGSTNLQRNVKDLGFYGDWNRTFKKSRSLENIENPNTITVDDNIQFSSNNENINGLVELIRTINSNFDLQNYEMKVYKLTDDGEYYTIDFIHKIDGFNTNLGYNINVEDGKVTYITNNDKELAQTMSINSKLDKKQEQQYNDSAIDKLKQKAVNGELGSTFDENIEILEQNTSYYLDINTGKREYIVSSSYTNMRGEIAVDTCNFEL